jgi:hypothetical protein
MKFSNLGKNQKQLIFKLIVFFKKSAIFIIEINFQRQSGPIVIIYINLDFVRLLEIELLSPS